MNERIFLMSKTTRLDKFVSGLKKDLSRSGVKLLCKQKRITVNGECAKPDQKIDAESDEVCLDGERLVFKEHIYIMLNKPSGYVCSTRDGKSPTVLELVPDRLYRKGLFPAGRLDKDTEGFVLITDDGKLSHAMLSPKHHVPKKYYVELKDPISQDTDEKFSNGIEIDGGDICKPAILERIKDKPRACYLTICEGKYHQIKRMFSAVGNEVVYLKRIAIGDMVLDVNLPLGKCLEILHKDIRKLLVIFESHGKVS